MDKTFGKTPMPRSEPASLLLCGYYGEHNLGDDALLQVLLQRVDVSNFKMDYQFKLLILCFLQKILRQLILNL